jgi:hypothetical protein
LLAYVLCKSPKINFVEFTTLTKRVFVCLAVERFILMQPSNDFFNKLAYHDRGDFLKVRVAFRRFHKPFCAAVVVLIFFHRRLDFRNRCFKRFLFLSVGFEQGFITLFGQPSEGAVLIDFIRQPLRFAVAVPASRKPFLPGYDFLSFCEGANPLKQHGFAPHFLLFCVKVEFCPATRQNRRRTVSFSRFRLCVQPFFRVRPKS